MAAAGNEPTAGSATRAKTVLVAGASGVIGQAATGAFAQAGDWRVVSLSRRAPPAAGPNHRHVALDLTDPDRCRAALSEIGPVSHLVFTALYEKPDIVQGWRDPEQMAVNLAMLRNLLDPLAESGALEHVSILQGTKAYGVHIRPFPVPARESWPRHPHENFYWLQEDHLRDRAAAYGFGFSIFRPQIVFGTAVGVAMNIVPVLGVYAAMRREEGLPFSYPGGPDYVLEATCAELMGRALLWAAESPAARNEIFNITNGDVFVWRNIWPRLAEYLGMETGPDTPMSVADYITERADLWDRIVARHGLAPNTLEALVGHSHRYADFCMAHGASRPPAPVLVSTIKLRQAGFGDCIDTEEMFRRQIATLRAERILP